MNKAIICTFLVISNILAFNLLDNYSYATVLNPVVDGSYYEFECCVCAMGGCECFIMTRSINNGIVVESDYSHDPLCFQNHRNNIGLMEFDISSIDGLFTRGRLEAVLALKVKEGDLSSDRCISLYSIEDYRENGEISVYDPSTQEFIGEICADFQPGDIITLDVTTAIEHDLFDPDQTDFSGFVLDRSTDWSGFIEFYDHTDPAYAPRLNIIDIYSDFDEDGIPYLDDNCPNTSNPDQWDTYPPEGNGIGDACDCECDFTCDGDVDATDVTSFLGDFGRSTFFNPCTNEEPCNGDFDCNVNVDADDVTKFLEDFGRSQFFNPCPKCTPGTWCVYP